MTDWTPPRELDVPHWARAMVDNYRRDLKLPAEVTDRHIYAVLVEAHGADPDVIQDMLREMEQEVCG